MHDHPFATLVTPTGPEPLISHLPLLYVADCEPHGTLLGHFARANPALARSPGPRIDRGLPRPACVRVSVVVRRTRASPCRPGTTRPCMRADRRGRRRPGRTRASILDALVHRFEAGPRSSVGTPDGARRGATRWSGRSSRSGCGSGASTPSSSCRRTAASRIARASRPRSSGKAMPTPRRPRRGCSPTAGRGIMSRPDREAAPAAADPPASASTSGCGRRGSTGRARSPRRRSMPARSG